MVAKIYIKSQLTIIIIVGILIFAMTILLLYLVLSRTEKKLSSQSITSQHTTPEIASVREYVNKCLEDTSSRALEMMGKQGGNIYTSQGGRIPDPQQLGTDYLQFGSSKVMYGLKQPTGDITNIFFANPPQYPWIEFPYIDSSFTSIQLSSNYGQNLLPQLNVTNTSMLAQLVYYLDHNTASCLNFRSAFKSYNITYTNVSSSVIIADNNLKGNLIINARIPIEINKVTGEQLTKMDSFSVPLKVRLALIYKLANTIIDKESSDLNFDAAQVTYDDMSVSVTRNVFNKDDIFTVTDSKSTLYGKQYSLQFSVQNRYPILHYIIEKNLPQLKEGDLITFNSSSPLIIIHDGETLFEQDPSKNNPTTKSAYDPDNDQLNFSHNPALQYTIGAQDVPPFANEWSLRVQVSDGQLADYQDITFETVESKNDKK